MHFHQSEKNIKEERKKCISFSSPSAEGDGHLTPLINRFSSLLSRSAKRLFFMISGKKGCAKYIQRVHVGFMERSWRVQIERTLNDESRHCKIALHFELVGGNIQVSLSFPPTLFELGVPQLGFTREGKRSLCTKERGFLVHRNEVTHSQRRHSTAKIDPGEKPREREKTPKGDACAYLILLMMQAEH